jgi:Flp pilus assembly protein TadB
MAGAGGLEQSIMACASISPMPIRREVMHLAARLERDRLAPSLREFAEELDDPTGDLVVASLVLAADKNPKRLGELLGMLAASAREEVRMRLRVEAGRARARTSVKVVIGAVIIITGLVILLNREFLDAYDSIVGQIVLAIVGAWFALWFAVLSWMTKFTETERFLTEDIDFGEARI